MIEQIIRGAISALILSAMIGCTPMGIAKGDSNRAFLQTADSTNYYGPDRPYQAIQKSESGIATEGARPASEDWAEAPPLSPGDRVTVDVHDGDDFSGLYEVDIDGALKLPHLPSLRVAGFAVEEAESAIENALVAAELFREDRVKASVRVQLWAAVQVHISGAVFNPGMVTANARSTEERALKTAHVTGDFPPERMLVAAVRAAGGVRPDADVGRIKLVRKGKTMYVDYSGVAGGHGIQAAPLMRGDVIVVPSTGKFNRKLVKPSAITAPGVRVFLSNLTAPATSNSQSAVGKDSTSLPYGSRLLTAAISGNCVGGTNSTNGSRYTVLVRTNPLTGHEEVIERSVDSLLRAPSQDEVNPYMMPGDGIACYDSGVTNIREVARTIYEVLLPFTLL